MSKRIEVRAKRAYKLIEKPQRWCKEAEARDNRGKCCEVDSDKACRFCAMGAIYKVYGRDQGQTLIDSINNKLGQDLDSFNDTNNHKAVYKLLKKLGI